MLARELFSVRIKYTCDNKIFAREQDLRERMKMFMRQQKFGTWKNKNVSQDNFFVHTVIYISIQTEKMSSRN